MTIVLRNLLAAFVFIILYYGMDVLLGSYTLTSLPFTQIFYLLLLLLALFFAIDFLNNYYQQHWKKK